MLRIIEIYIGLFYIFYPFQDITLLIPYLKLYYVIFLLFLFLLIIFLLFKNKFIRIIVQYTKISFLYLFFLFWILLSLGWSLVYSESVYAIFKYFLYFLIGFVLFASIKDKFLSKINIIAISIFISSLAVCLIYLSEFVVQGVPILLSGKATMREIANIASINVGFGGGRNLLASWLVFSLTFAFPILYTTLSKRIKILLILGVLIQFIVVLLTLSRTSQLALFVFILLLGFFTNSRILKNLIRNFYISVIVLLTLILAFNTLHLRDFLVKRFMLAIYSLMGEAEDYGTSGRMELWTYAIKSIQENFFLGTGIGTLYQGMDEIGGVHNYHNIFLQFFAQTGVIGFIIFVAWTLWIFYLSYKLRKFYRHNLQLKLIADITFINLIVYYFKSLLMFQYFDLEIWTIIPVIFALYYKGR